MSRRPMSAPFAALAWLAASAAPLPAYAQAQREARVGDDHLIVDCLLPGAVRRLGTRMVVQGRRSAARVSARDCAIRGGEYVAFDRASYSTSLAVWRPLAEGGDATAQTYVGDIFAKGLGRAPDYSEAARWYRMAADQNFGPAMFTLGTLYENGAGVPRSRETAVALYRRAAGMPEDGSSSTQAVADVGSLRSELSGQRAEAERLQEQVRALQAELALNQRTQGDHAANLQRERREIAAQRDALERERAAFDMRTESVTADATRSAAERAGIAQQRGDLASREAALRQREEGLTEREAAATRQDRALVDRHAELERLDGDLSRRSRELASAPAADNTQLEAERREAAQLRAQVRSLEEQLSVRQRETTEAAARLQLERTELEAQRATLVREGADLERQRASVNDTRTADRAESTRIERERTQLQTRAAELERREAGLNAREITLARRSEEPADSPAPQIALMEPDLLQTRGGSGGFVLLRERTSAVRIRGRVSAPAGLSALTINGQRVNASRGGEFSREMRISSDSTNVLIAARDVAGRSGDLQFELRRRVATPTSPPPAAVTAPSGGADVARAVVAETGIQMFRAILIANENYRDTAFGRLSTPGRDVREIAEILQRNYGFQVEIVADASGEQLAEAMSRFREQLGENDSVVVYYAGHGRSVLEGGAPRGYWIPVDGMLSDPSTWVSPQRVQGYLERYSARKVLVIADSCFSGLIPGRDMLSERAAGSIAEWQANARPQTRAYFTSGGDAPVADQGGRGHSVFAQAMIDALSANRATIEGRTLFKTVEQSVLRLTGSRQRPAYQSMAEARYGEGGAGTFGGDFIFVPAT